MYPIDIERSALSGNVIVNYRLCILCAVYGVHGVHLLFLELRMRSRTGELENWMTNLNFLSELFFGFFGGVGMATA